MFLRLLRRLLLLITVVNCSCFRQLIAKLGQGVILCATTCWQVDKVLTFLLCGLTLLRRQPIWWLIHNYLLWLIDNNSLIALDLHFSCSRCWLNRLLLLENRAHCLIIVIVRLRQILILRLLYKLLLILVSHDFSTSLVRSDCFKCLDHDLGLRIRMTVILPRLIQFLPIKSFHQATPTV